MGIFLGIDTSNYTTSAAVYDSDCDSVTKAERLLPVKAGERGIRQSDAVFHHTRAMPQVLSEVLHGQGLTSVGVSTSPTTEPGSYMPCFLAGENTAAAVALSQGIELFRFSHQQGHIASALWSGKVMQLKDGDFLAFHISGGTTDLLYVSPSDDGLFAVKTVFSSLDLKAGQAVDRLGVRMGMMFPAGKELDALARESRKSYSTRVKLIDGACSLSGLENKCGKMLMSGEQSCDIARFLFDSIADVLIAMTDYARGVYGQLPVLFSGGVMSNSVIKERLSGLKDTHFAEPEFSRDNAAGIAILASMKRVKR